MWTSLAGGALSLRFGVLGLGDDALATFSLPVRREPAAEFSQVFRILSVTTVPTLRLVVASAILVKTGSRAGDALWPCGAFF
jgi:hypothetical protein